MSNKSYYKLKELCDIETGKLDANAMEESGKYPFFTCAKEPLRINEYAFNCECVLIGGNNANGNFPINFYNGKFNAYQRTYVITKKGKSIVNIKYIYYYLSLTLLELKRHSQGSLTKFLTIGLLENIKIPKKSKKEYDDIANLINIYDECFNNNINLINSLEKYSQLLFHKWFVDFDFPDKEGKEYRNNGGKIIEKNRMMMPVEWEYEKLGKGTLSKLIPSGIDEFEGYKRYIPTSEIQGNIIISEGEEVTMKDKPSRANMQPRVNSVWFAKMQDSVKHIFIPKNENYLVDNYIFSTGMSGLQCNDLSFYYISCIINSEKFERKKDRLCIGSTQKAINNNGIKSIKILRPSDSVLEKFNTEVGNVIEQIELLKYENKLLEETRDLLIKKLIK